MKLRNRLTIIPLFLANTLGLGASSAADKVPPEFAAAAEAARDAVPLGGDFQPKPAQPAIVAVGHGGRIVLSKDDGRSWEQVHFGHLGSDHGPWATKAVAYSQGVFVVPVGWGAPSMWLASEDGVNWRHLTDGKSPLTGVKGADENPAVMAGTWGIAGGDGIFVSGGYMTMSATPDFGRSFTTFSLREFKDDPRPRDLVTHHVGPIWCGETSGRFLALGNDRSKTKPVFGNLFASDDRGQSWHWLNPGMLETHCQGYSGIASNGARVAIADKLGANLFLSNDAGDTWQGPFETSLERATLSRVGAEFWMVSPKGSRATTDGLSWRDLSEGLPAGKIIATSEGTLLNVERRRCSILRSTDGGQSWSEVFAYDEPDSPHIHGAQGLRDIAVGPINTKPIRQR